LPKKDDATRWNYQGFILLVTGNDEAKNRHQGQDRVYQVHKPVSRVLWIDNGNYLEAHVPKSQTPHIVCILRESLVHKFVNEAHLPFDSFDLFQRLAFLLCFFLQLFELLLIQLGLDAEIPSKLEQF
jgi:hypothetical protein